MKKLSSDDQDFELWILLSHTRNAITKLREQELEEFNVSPQQSAILHLLETAEDNITPAKVSRRFFREPHSVSELISRMEKRGLVKRMKDLPRKNMVRIVLTDEGHDIYQRSKRARKPVLRIMSKLSNEQREQLRLFLTILQDAAVDEIEQAYKSRFHWTLS